MKNAILATALFCCLTASYATEQPPQFASLTPSKIAATCALQMVSTAGEIYRGPVFEEPKKTEIVQSLLKLHIVWVRLRGSEDYDTRGIMKKIQEQDVNALRAANDYCIIEGGRMYAALSTEGKNRINSRTLDLYTQLVQ